jgi:ATP-binding cassette subfamily B protein
VPGSAARGAEGGRWIDPELRRALAYVLPYAGRLAPVLGLSLAGTLLSLYLPFLSRSLVDEALVGGDAGALVRIVSLFVALSVVNFGLNLGSGLRYTRVSADVLFDMRLRLYTHLQRLSPRFFARTPLGEIVSRLNNDIGEIQRVAAETALAWIGHLLFLAGAVGMMLWLDARLFLVSLALLPLSVWTLVRYRRRLEGSVTEMREQSARIGSFLIETLQGMRLVVASNAQGREALRFRAANDDFVRALMRMQWLRYLAGGLPGLLLTAGTALVFLYGGARVISGATTLGTFVAFMAYQSRLLSPVQGLMGLYAGVATVRVSLRRVHELLDTPPEVEESPSARPMPAARGELRLDDVRFSFGRGGAVLDGVSLRVEAGETVAVVGVSGSGKSTLVDLLIRQFDPDSGRVALDGHDLRDLRLADVRRHVVAVEQEPVLLHASLAENLRYARPGASEAELLEAVRAAGLDDLLAELPEGLGTVVGERGRMLSVGERQRIALARALLADPAVLVLDEPTASLDPRSQERVLLGYRAAMRGRTTLLISHRLEVALQARRVVVLQQGRIAEQGPPHELLRRSGPFRRLFAAEAEPVGEPALVAPLAAAGGAT